MKPDSLPPWPKGSAEEKVTRFYAHGVENYGDFHGGYLNFGWWDDGQEDYLVAAETLVRKLAGMLRLAPESRLLDVACGMGGQDVLIAKEFPVGKITAFDLMAEHLVHVKRRVDASGTGDKIEMRQGTATALPFPDASYDRVLCIEGIVHFKTREKFFQECQRVLKPGGRVVFSDYAVRKEPRNAAERGILRLVTALWNIPYENADSPRQYKARLERNGFKNVVVHEVGERVIPGYCREQARPECIAELVRIRGWFAGRVGHVIDVVLDKAYRMGLVEYVLVEADVAK